MHQQKTMAYDMLLPFLRNAFNVTSENNCVISRFEPKCYFS